MKKGHSLAYQFEWTMEFGDASDEEAPPPNLKKREMLKHSWLQMISMLQAVESDGNMTAIIKRFNVACSTVYQLWKYAVCTHATGIIISPELNSQKKFWEATYLSNRVCSRGCQEHATKEEMYTAKTCSINGSVKNNCASLNYCFYHSCAF